MHPKAPDTFLKFLRIPEAVCNAEEDPVLSQKAMLHFLRESRNPGREAEGINRERSADCTVPSDFFHKAPDAGSRGKFFVGKKRKIRIMITTSLS